jgi:pimeloyl-ACP methyl ester carboxylesterase
MDDRQIVYFHGLPGGPRELQAFGEFTLPLFAPDRCNDAPHLKFPAYVDYLAQCVRGQFPQGSIMLVGFSAGARMALELGVKLEDRDIEIILVSGAAPLQSGEFLNDMAGRLVFGAAKASPPLFSVLTTLQSLLARWAPGGLFRTLISTAQGSDQALKIDERFTQVIKSVIVKTLQSGSVGYRREVLAYVAPWGHLLSRVKAPATLWHGTEDNWTPIGMADAMEAALPNVRAVHRLPGLSHYSTLKAFLADLQGATE